MWQCGLPVSMISSSILLFWINELATHLGGGGGGGPFLLGEGLMDELREELEVWGVISYRRLSLLHSSLTRCGCCAEA